MEVQIYSVKARSKAVKYVSQIYNDNNKAKTKTKSARDLRYLI